MYGWRGGGCNPWRHGGRRPGSAWWPGGRGGGVLPWVLLHLAESPAHGYELIERYGQGAHGCGMPLLPGTLYRWLRALEHHGLVASRWETGESGPARRRYTLTPAGWQVLDELAARLADQRRQIDAFLEAYHRVRPRRPEQRPADAGPAGAEDRSEGLHTASDGPEGR